MNRNLLYLGSTVTAMVLLLGASTAGGFTHVESLEGSITFSDATATGKNTASTMDLGAAFVQAEHPIPYGRESGPLGGVFEGHAQQILVNWSYLREKAVGDPTSNNALILVDEEKKQGDKLLRNAEISFSYRAEQADILFVPQGGAQATLAGQGTGKWGMQSAPTSVWRAGDSDYDSVSPNVYLAHTHETDKGSPLVTSNSGVKWHIEGDVTLYVWGPDVTIKEPDSEEQSFRSGIWRTDHVGDEQHPGGVAWDQHYQFLRIELTNANLTLNHQNGPAMWTAQELTSQINGTISYAAKRGFLQSTQFEYGFDDEIVTLEGDLTQNVKKRQGAATEIRALVEGSASVDLPPSTERTTGPNSRDFASQPQAGDVAPQYSFEPKGGIWISTWLFLLVLALILVVMNKDTIKQHNIFRSSEWLVSNSMKLASHDPKRGLKMARLAVLKARNDWAAWNNYGIHLMDLGRAKTVLAKLKPAAERLQEPTLTYHVACALAETRADDEEVLKWLEKLVEQDPDAKYFLTQDPYFKRLRNHPGLKRLAAEPDMDDDTTTAYV